MAGVYRAVLTGDWAKLGGALAQLSAQFPAAMQAALEEEGEFYRGKIIEGIRKQAPGDQAFRPLSPVTLALRRLLGFRGTKALIQSGELRNNIQSVPQKGIVFVGILYTARGRDGRKLADIGKINEFGATIRAVMSKKRMRLIASLMRKTGMGGSGGGRGAATIRIPPRPFIRPTFALYGGQRGAERFMARVSRKLGGLLGVINHPDLGGFSAGALPGRLASGNLGRAMRTSRAGMTKKAARPGKNPKSAGKAIMRSILRTTRRPGVRLARGARVKRGPRVTIPKAGGFGFRRNRPARAKAPKAPKLRAPRAPKAPKPARVRAPRPGATVQKQAAKFNRANQAAAKRHMKQARQQARAQIKASRKQNRAIRKAGRTAARQQRSQAAAQRRAAAQQRKLARQQKRDAKAAARAQRAAARTAKSQAKKQARSDKYVSMFTRLLEKREGQHQPHSAHVKAYRKHLKGQRADAHVKAYRTKQKQPQHSAHVKAYRKQQKKK